MPPRKSPDVQKPTMKDVGILAGVSQSTVSHVVNRTGKIPPETTKRVREAILQLGFRPNDTARNLRLQQSKTIGLITDRIATTPFAGKVLLGAQEYAWERGYLLLVVDTGLDAEIEVAAVDAMLSRQVDGLLYASMSWGEVDTPAAVSKVPTMLINAWSGTDLSLPAVVPDEVAGGRLAARVVISAGHRRIAYLGGPDDDQARIERERGFREEHEASGLAVDPRLVLTGDYHVDTGYRLAGRLLTEPDPPSALVCGNDRMALGAIMAALSMGLQVPADLSIVGYDDQEEIADQITPNLTTVSIPHYEMGRTAAKLLLKAIDTGKPPVGTAVPGGLILRDSVAPPALT